ncbi:EcsC family protein [Paracoccaceae bacterium GXU_MW_L88]
MSKAKTEFRPLTSADRDEIRALAKRAKNANTLMMRAINAMGGQLENVLTALPGPVQRQMEGITATALETAYNAASRVGGRAPDLGKYSHEAAVVMTGGVGGAAGLSAVAAELPVTTTLILRAIQRVAADHGFDPNDEAVRKECLKVLGAGGPGTGDDGVDTSFLTSRFAIHGTALREIIQKVAPRFALTMGQKLGAQTVPILGGVAGATINYAFINYYKNMAHIRFGLQALAREHDPQDIRSAFEAALR